MDRRVFNYKHQGTIKRFKSEFPELKEHAETIFADLMRFFWASIELERLKEEQPDNDEFDFIYIMDEEMKWIDQMWHIFLLYTQDYMDFCHQYFGEYLHHLPDIVGRIKGNYLATLEEGNENSDLENYNEEHFEINLERFLSFTYDRLGEDVVRRWYAPLLV